MGRLRKTRSKATEQSTREQQRWQKRMENPVLRQQHQQNERLRRMRQKEEKIEMENDNSRLSQRVTFLSEKINQLMNDMFLISRDMELEEDSSLQAEDLQDEIRWIDVVEQYASEFEETIQDWHRFVGLDKEIFEQLSDGFADHYYSLTWDGTVRKTKQRKRTLNHRTALFITLLLFRQYCTGTMMQSIFRVHERTLTKVYRRVLSALQRHFAGRLGWPNRKELDKLPSPNSDLPELEGVKFVVDGTIIRMYRSKLKFRKGLSDPYYQPSKGKHGENTLVFIDFNGRIVWNTKLYPAGKYPDQRIWNHENLKKYFVDTGAGLLGDLGFTFESEEFEGPIHGVQPVNYERRSKDPELAEFSRQVSRHRVLIEHVFTQLKFFRIIGGQCRHFHPNAKQNDLHHDLLDMDVVMDVLCCIHNLDLQTRPMHDASRESPEDS